MAPILERCQEVICNMQMSSLCWFISVVSTWTLFWKEKVSAAICKWDFCQHFLPFFPDKYTRNSCKVVFRNWEVSKEKFGICNDGLQPEICTAWKEPSLSISDLPSSSSSQYSKSLRNETNLWNGSRSSWWSGTPKAVTSLKNSLQLVPLYK